MHNLVNHTCSRPYRLENTGSRPITAVKLDWDGVSTWMGDRLGILRVVSSVFSPGHRSIIFYAKYRIE